MATAKSDYQPEIIDSSLPISATTSSNLDDTYDAYKKAQVAEIEPREAKRVLRKIDKRIVPILFFIYLLQYLDKNGINYASVYGLKKATNLKGQDYSWLGKLFPRFRRRLFANRECAGSIFYFGYLVAQYPSGYLMQRLPIAKFLGAVTLGRLPKISKLIELTLLRMGVDSYDNTCLH
jgi:hypothetical protein